MLIIGVLLAVIAIVIWCMVKSSESDIEIKKRVDKKKNKQQ